VSWAAQASTPLGDLVEVALTSQIPDVSGEAPGVLEITNRSALTPPAGNVAVRYVRAATTLVMSVVPLRPARYRTVQGVASHRPLDAERVAHSVASFSMENTNVVVVPAPAVVVERVVS